MADENSQPPTPPSPSNRRSSFSPGQKFSEMFSRSPTGGSGATNAYPGPIATAAANAQSQHRRRTSISALLGTSPTQPFFSARNRAESLSSSGNNSIDESAIEEGDAAPPGQSPNSTFGRRLSFGARALRDARAGNGNNNGRPPSTIDESSPSAPGGQGGGRGSPKQMSPGGNFGKRLSNQFHTRSGEGFTWSEQLRSRAERSSSTTTGPMTAREPPRSAPPAAETPPTPKPVKKERPVPDHFQERILKGDFYMD